MELGGRGKGKENDRESTISKVESNRRARTDQSTVCLQLRYTRKSLYTWSLELKIKDGSVK
jgi:hypothetical protein